MFHHARVIAVLLLLGALMLASCSEDAAVNPPGGEIEAVYDVEYQDHATVFDEDEQDVLVSADTASGTNVYDASYFSSDPEPGDVIVVSGTSMRKVKSVRKEGNTYVIETEDAVLTDVVKNGTIAWNFTPDWTDVSRFKWEGGRVQDLRDHVTAPGDTLQFEIERSGVKHVVQIVPKLQDGQLTVCDFIFQMTKEQAGKPTIVFLGKGSMSMPRQKTKIVVKDGKVSELRSDNNALQCDIELSMSAAGQQGGDHSLTLPGAAVEIPIRYLPTPAGGLVPNPIPMSIGIGVQFVTQISMPSTEASAQATAKLSISTDTGFEYKGTTVEAKATLNSEDIRDGDFDAAALIGVPVNVEFGFAFPRVSLNIVGQEFAWVHTGFTAGSELQWGPVCKSGYAKMVVQGGYNFGFVGLSQIELKKTFVEREKSINCD